MQQTKITDDLDALMQVLPPSVEQALRAADQGENLLEIILDLGRVPEARFVDHEVILSPKEVTAEDLDLVISHLGQFTGDNRAGIERTLHRISCIRNRQGRIIGLTCRVGRAIYGVIDIIEDIVKSGQSILLLGRPGVGKTTLLREAARVLGEKKRVIVVDTSNEIGGDGDIPHPAIGRARRMQVAAPEFQHEVMIEAVENHMPEVIVIDEIGREQEAAAARTIAERGVQLFGTAHGITLENLLMNPTLSDLVGGIESVTLSDEEARRRGTQKAVLERRAPPTFDVLIELQDRQRMAVHHNVATAVDAMLRGRSLNPEIRYRDESGQVRIQAAPVQPTNEVRATFTPAAGRLPFEKQNNGRHSEARSETRSDAREPAADGRAGCTDSVQPASADLSVWRRARAAGAGGAESGRAGGGGRFAGGCERCGDAEKLLPQASAADRRCRTPAHPRLCAALKHGQSGRGVPGRHLRHHSGDGRSGRARHRRDARGDSPRAGRRSFRGVASGLGRGAASAARDGALVESRFAQLWQRAAASRAHLPRLIALDSRCRLTSGVCL